MSEKEKYKQAVRIKLNVAIKNGLIQRPIACGECGAITRYKIQAHHNDYSLPFDVVWLCCSCHKHRHVAISYLRRLYGVYFIHKLSSVNY